VEESAVRFSGCHPEGDLLLLVGCHSDRSAAEWRNSAVFPNQHSSLDSKIKLRKGGKFSDPKKCPSTNHNSPAIHHNFTTKNHTEKPRFRKKTPAKTPFYHQEKN
jgi:hypothetical protein